MVGMATYEVRGKEAFPDRVYRRDSRVWHSNGRGQAQYCTISCHFTRLAAQAVENRQLQLTFDRI